MDVLGLLMSLQVACNPLFGKPGAYLVAVAQADSLDQQKPMQCGGGGQPQLSSGIVLVS